MATRTGHTKRVKDISGDRVHGAAWLSRRALEMLRDHAAELARDGATVAEAQAELRSLARGLRAARPAMAVIANRVNRLMREAAAADAVTFRAAAQRELDRAATADDRAAAHAAPLVAGRRVLTLSRSATVERSLVLARPQPAVVFVAESLPGGEGRPLAGALRAAGLTVELVADSDVCAVLASRGAEVLVVGADAVLADGAVINKTGTKAAAEVASAARIPSYAVAATDKVGAASPGEDAVAGEEEMPLFEVTPAVFWSGIVTEEGILDRAGVRRLAADHGRLADW